MLHTRIIPRVPFAVRPVPGLPGSLLQPIPVPTAGDLAGVPHAWTVAYLHLLAMHALYGRIGLRRPLGRLHDLTVGLLPVVQRVAGVESVRAALAAAHHAVEDIDEAADVLSQGDEAGWWIVALQASLALGVWYELSPAACQCDQDFVSGLSVKIRRLLGTVFDARVADAIQAAAHGDGDGDLLAQIAAGALALGAPLVGMPEPMEQAR